MKKGVAWFKRFPVFAVVFACAALLFAEGEKARMLERAPQLSALKSRGVIGEKSDGLLGFVKASPADRAVVAAENLDRQAVYVQIARSSGTTAALVAARRALQIVEQAASGDWLQHADGTWYQKK